jgi:hypothetical protein
MMHSELTLVFALLFAAFPSVVHPASATGYSRKATDVWTHVSGDPRPVIIRSPDRHSRVSFRWISEKNGDEHVEIDTFGAVGQSHFDLGAGVDSEVLWSPDSSAFFITTSDGGAAGPYRLLTFQRDRHGVKIVDITPLVERAFGHPVRCDTPSSPNVAGVTWLDGAKRVLAVGEVYPDTNCDSMGTFKAYEVDLRRRHIVRIYDQLEAKKLFAADLGHYLLDADDACVRVPKSCWVNTNHLKTAPAKAKGTPPQ